VRAMKSGRTRWPAGIAALIAGAAAIAAGAAVLQRPDATLGLPPVAPQPADKVALGRQLFVDKRLSADGTMACATCHVPEHGFTQNDRRTPQGRDGNALRRNASTLLNVAYASPLMHDGAAPSLEVQALTPLFDSNEMANHSFDDLQRRLEAIPGYREAFRRVFDRDVTTARIGEALAAYQRTLRAGNAPFDRWAFGGEADAMPQAAERGYRLFVGKAGCVDCHAVGATTALFSDNAMHNTGARAARPTASPASATVTRSTGATVDFAAAGDRGRHEVTQVPADLGRFRTPTLRNVALTAPYMHDGSLATLPDVVRFYAGGGGANDNLDPAVRPLALDDREIQDLVAFLESLTASNVGELAAAARQAERTLPPAVSP
jgi:cytochrome c peroxidase